MNVPSAANCCGLCLHCGLNKFQVKWKWCVHWGCRTGMYHSQSFLPFLHLFYDYLVSFRYTLFFFVRFSISILLFVDCHSFYYCCHCHWNVYIKYNPKTAGNYFLFNGFFFSPVVCIRLVVFVFHFDHLFFAVSWVSSCCVPIVRCL